MARLFKRKHKCTNFKWGEPYMENWTKVEYDDYDLFGCMPPKKIKFKALAQKGVCETCGLVKIRKV